MKLTDYHFLYNAAAHFAARNRYGAEERAKLDALITSTGEADRRKAEYLEAVEKLQKEVTQAEFVAQLSAQTAEGFDALCWAVAELANQGELYSRYMGNDPREMLTPERVRVELKPYQISEAKALIMSAIISGIKPEENQGGEVDEVLEVLQKKTAKH